MRRFLFGKIFAVMVWLAACSWAVPDGRSSAAAELSAREILRKNGSSVVMITGEDDRGDRSVIGSGFVADSRGAVLTNFHVLAGSRNLRVETSDGKSFAGVTLAAADRGSDFALLKLPGGPFASVRIGDSDAVQAGDRVYVIGSPRGLENTITDGLLSARREGLEGTLFQISAPVSPGSSGSPVFNSRGEAIGIATASYSSAQNLNFAIPINEAKDEIVAAFDTAVRPAAPAPSGIRTARRIEKNFGPRKPGVRPGISAARRSALLNASMELSRLKTEMIQWVYGAQREYLRLGARDGRSRQDALVLAEAVGMAKDAIKGIETYFVMLVLAENSADRGRTDPLVSAWAAGEGLAVTQGVTGLGLLRMQKDLDGRLGHRIEALRGVIAGTILRWKKISILYKMPKGG